MSAVSAVVGGGALVLINNVFSSSDHCGLLSMLITRVCCGLLMMK